jgi:hypothetical protein
MNDSQQLRDAMWDLVYGLLSDDESQVLVARIKSDPQAARLYAEVRLQADLVGHASRVEDSSFALQAHGAAGPTPAVREKRATPAATRQAVAKRSAAWLVGIASTALAALLAVGIFWPRTSERLLARSFLATDVVAQRSMPAGLTNRVTVRTYYVAHGSEPAEGTSANVALRLLDRAGQETFSKAVVTNGAGQATVEIPGEVLEPGVRLEVRQAIAAAQQVDRDAQDGATAAQAETRTKQMGSIAADLPVQAEPNLAYLFLSEPTVEPGKQVEYSFWNFRAFTARPSPVDESQTQIDELTRFAVTNPTAETPAQNGVIKGTLQVPADTLAPAESSALGRGEQAGKTIDARLAQSSSNGKAQVLRRKAEELGANAPVPEERLAGARLRSESLPQIVQLNQTIPRYSKLEVAPRLESAKETSAPAQAGQAAAAGGELQLPEALSRESESIATFAAGSPLVVAIPSQLLGRPLTAAATCRGVTVATGSWPPDESTFSRADGGGTMKKEVSQISLPLPPEADGLIEVALFDRRASTAGPVQRQWVYREPRRKLQIELPDIRGRVAPGEDVQLTLRVTDEHGLPATDTRVGVRVWNEQLVQQSAELPVLLADAVHNGGADMASEAAGLPQERLAERLEQIHRNALAVSNRQLMQEKADSGAKQALADQAPASGERDLKKIAEAAREAKTEAATNADSYGRLSGYVAPPMPSDGEKLGVEFSYGLSAPLAAPEPVELASNRNAVEAAFRQASASAEASRQRAVAIIGGGVMIGGMTLLVLLGILALRRIVSSAGAVTPVLVVALASFVIGLVWLGGTPRGRISAIAMAPAASKSAAMPEAAAINDPNGDSNLGLPELAAPAAADAPLGDTIVADRMERFNAPAEPTARPAANLAAAPPPLPAPVGAPAGPPAREPQPASTELQPAPTATALPAVAGGAAPVDDSKSKDALNLAPKATTIAANGAGGGGGAKLGSLDADQDKQVAPPVSRPALAFGGGAGQAAGRAAAPRGGAGPEGAARGLPAANKPLEKALADGLPAAADPASVPPPGAAGQLASEAKGKFAAAPASLYFNPELTTDAQGQVTVRFVMPQVDSEYRLLIDALGQGRIGSRQTLISCGPAK